MCRGIWTAASAQAKRRANQEITGRSFAVDARHGGPLLAANLLGTGERYGYAFLLQQALLARGPVEQLHIDIMCKWRPWAAKLVEGLQAVPLPHPDAHTQALAHGVREHAPVIAAMRQVNSAAHGQLHAQSCQVCVCVE